MKNAFQVLEESIKNATIKELKQEMFYSFKETLQWLPQQQTADMIQDFKVQLDALEVKSAYELYKAIAEMKTTAKREVGTSKYFLDYVTDSISIYSISHKILVAAKIVYEQEYLATKKYPWEKDFSRLIVWDNFWDWARGQKGLL